MAWDIPRSYIQWIYIDVDIIEQDGILLGIMGTGKRRGYIQRYIHRVVLDPALQQLPLQLHINEPSPPLMTDIVPPMTDIVPPMTDIVPLMTGLITDCGSSRGHSLAREHRIDAGPDGDGRKSSGGWSL
jgi:hypothetical protein